MIGLSNVILLERAILNITKLQLHLKEIQGLQGISMQCQFFQRTKNTSNAAHSRKRGHQENEDFKTFLFSLKLQYENGDIMLVTSPLHYIDSASALLVPFAGLK